MIQQVHRRMEKGQANVCGLHLPWRALPLSNDAKEGEMLYLNESQDVLAPEGQKLFPPLLHVVTDDHLKEEFTNLHDIQQTRNEERKE